VSYLSPLRLHFSGTFEAAVSTVNNDPVHYDNARFQPSWALPATGGSPSQLGGSFSPDGTGDWKLHDCTVTAAFLPDGAPAAATDPVLSGRVADSDRRAPAKLVDLDPEQQLVSMIFGLELRVTAADGSTLLRGEFEPAAFTDIWDRGAGGDASGDIAAGAMYQSVLTRLAWSDVSDSRFLRALRATTRDRPAAARRLSVKFNVDGFSLQPGAGFMRGRIVGTIGPAGPGEPGHFVAGRQFMTVPGPGGDFFAPAGRVNFCAAVVDDVSKRVYLDLGNALPTAGPGGALADLGDLALYLPPAPSPAPQAEPAPTEAGTGPAAGTPAAPSPAGVLAAATYTQASWYPATAGISVFPPDRPLTDAELARAWSGPLTLVATVPGGPPATVISEPDSGLFVRADQFVFRLDAGRAATATLYATRFGRPHAGAAVLTFPVPGQLQPDSPLDPGAAPPVAVPEDAVRYDVRVRTDERGVARLRLRARDPGRPRGYIDGQVYALCPVLEETIATPGDPYPFNQWNYVSLLVWGGFDAGDPPTWHGDREHEGIEPVLRQYANLYPVMRDFLDLGDYDSVCAHAKLLSLVFSLDIGDPNAMPVTRDLSAARRSAIVRWLSEPGPDGKPLRGEPPASTPTPAPGTALAPGAPQTPPRHGGRGGKASAAGRRPAARRLAAWTPPAPAPELAAAERAGHSGTR
jgi:hypothetical protein